MELRIRLSDPTKDVHATLIGLKKAVEGCDVLVLPPNYRRHPRCVEEKGMAMALEKEIWYGSVING